MTHKMDEDRRRYTPVQRSSAQVIDYCIKKSWQQCWASYKGILEVMAVSLLSLLLDSLYLGSLLLFPDEVHKLPI